MKIYILLVGFLDGDECLIHQYEMVARTKEEILKYINENNNVQGQTPMAVVYMNEDELIDDTEDNYAYREGKYLILEKDI